MPVMGFTKFERFFRAAGGVSVDRDDIKRYLDFVNDAIYDLLLIGQATAKANVRDIIGLFPALADRRSVLAGNLSGGEQQMLAMARALMQEPRVLLIDEMSMGLAPIIVESLLPTVRRIADGSDAVVVLVEQHVDLALEVADRALVLVHGEVVLDRPADELRHDPGLLEAAYFGSPVSVGGR